MDRRDNATPITPPHAMLFVPGTGLTGERFYDYWHFHRTTFTRRLLGGTPAEWALLVNDSGRRTARVV